MDQELSPEEILNRYEWFKEAQAQIVSKASTIEVYRKRTLAMERAYEGVPRTAWSRGDIAQYNLWTAEVAGAVAGYNALVAEYNAQMAKANWAYCNTDNSLPREYTEYKEN